MPARSIRVNENSPVSIGREGRTDEGIYAEGLTVTAGQTRIWYFRNYSCKWSS